MRHLVDAVSRVGTCCGLLLAIAGVGARGAQARPAQLAARAFYAISYDSYQRWCLQSAPACAVPRKATTLPAGTRQVGFYFTLDYPTKHAGDMRAILYRLSITIRTGAGTLFTSYHSLARDTPAFQVSQVHLSTGAALIHAPQRQQDTTGSAYPDDTYRADLLIEGKPAAHASFIIGSGHAAPQGTPQARSQIRAFYAASETGYSTWTDFKTVPAPAAVLPSGRTTAVYFYLRWSGLSTSLPLRLGVLDVKSNTLVAETGTFNVPSPSGDWMYIVRTPDRSPYNDGAYQGGIIAGDTVLAKVSFSVGG